MSDKALSELIELVIAVIKGCVIGSCLGVVLGVVAVIFIYRQIRREEKNKF